MKWITISAIWCPACLLMRPKIDKLKEKYPSIEYIDYDYDMDEEEIQQYEIGTTLPVFILMNNDKEISRMVGEKKQEELEKMIGEVLS